MQRCSEMAALKRWMLVSSNIICVKMASNVEDKDKLYGFLLLADVLANSGMHLLKKSVLVVIF